MSHNNTLALETLKQTVIEDLQKNVIQSFKENIKVNGFRMSMITDLMKDMMLNVEKTALKGIEQKDLVLDVMLEFIESLSEDTITQEAKEMCVELLTNGTLSNTIDIIIAASRNELDLNVLLTNVKPNCIVSACKCVGYGVKQMIRCRVCKRSKTQHV